MAENLKREQINLQKDGLDISMTVNLTPNGEILGLGSKLRISKNLGGYGIDHFVKHVRADFVPQKDSPNKARLHRIYTVLKSPKVIHDVSVMEGRNFDHHKSKFEEHGFVNGFNWREIAESYLSQ